MTERKYVSTSTETGRVVLDGGVIFIAEDRAYGWDDKPLNNYKGYSVEFTDDVAGNSIAELAQLAVAMKNLPEEGVFDLDYDELLEYFKEWAAETAEEAEVPFTFTDRDGDSNTYSPAALWESSGGCEWETSAQEGYDYGWNI